MRIDLSAIGGASATAVPITPPIAQSGARRGSVVVASHPDPGGQLPRPDRPQQPDRVHRVVRHLVRLDVVIGADAGHHRQISVVGPWRSGDDGQRRHRHHGVEPAQGGGRNGVPDRAVEADRSRKLPTGMRMSATKTEPAGPGLAAGGSFGTGVADSSPVLDRSIRIAKWNEAGCRPARSPSPAAAHWCRK